MAFLPPPRAPRVEYIRTFHDDTFIDHYEWLRDKDSEAVISHLKAENEFTEQITADQQPLRDEIFAEIKERTLETDLSVPQRKGAWWYFARTVEGAQYQVYARVPAQDFEHEQEAYNPPKVVAGEPLAGEEILLDCNEFAKDMPFFSLGSFSVSEDGNWLTFGVDGTGDERYRQYTKNLSTGELLDETIDNVFAGAFLSPDASSIFYTVADDSWRPFELWRHDIGAGSADTLLYTENDPELWLTADLSADLSHLIINSSSSEYSELLLLDLTKPSEPPLVVIPRSERIQYSLEPLTLSSGERIVILQHDYQALNSELVIAPYPTGQSFATYRASFIALLQHQDTVRIEGFSFSQTHMVVSARINTTMRALFAPLKSIEELAQKNRKAVVFVEPEGFTEELYTSGVAALSMTSPVVRLTYTSWITPLRVYDYFPHAHTLILRKETPVLGDYSPEDYRAYRLWAPANDGTQIPISVVHRADLDLSQQHPVFQYGYGSYEASMDPMFSIPRLSLLDRGVIYVTAHVRGGGEMGRSWYQAGKKLHKKNTFTDFVDVTSFLSSLDYVNPQRIAACGGSAGGLLMGAIANLAPEKYCAIIAQVPFVDALTTILDPALPLSALEWEEWGNPIEDQEVYQYMKSYSPYENIRNLTYPPIVAVTSYNDTRVLYVEPAKWVAALRETIAADSAIPLLKIEMDGGHGGGSGRYTRWKEVAWDYAFALKYLLA